VLVDQWICISFFCHLSQNYLWTVESWE